MGSSLCVNCTIKTEECDMQAFPQVQQIMFEYSDLQEIPEISTPQDQQLQQPETDTSKNVASPQLRGILKYNQQQKQNLGNFCQDNRLSPITIQKKKVKFRKPSKLYQMD